jgi:hypothetical protein
MHPAPLVCRRHLKTFTQPDVSRCSTQQPAGAGGASNYVDWAFSTALSTLPPTVTGFAPTSTKAMTQGAVPLLPLDFLLSVMRDPNVPPDIRIKVALAAAPFVHPKARSGDPGDAAASAKLIEVDESPEGRGRRRINELEKQQVSKPLSADEQSKLDSLRALYPEPPDPVWEAFLKIKAEMPERCTGVFLRTYLHLRSRVNL